MGLFGNLGGDIGNFFSDLAFENGNTGKSIGMWTGLGLGGVPGAMIGGELGQGIENALTPPDYSGPLAAQQKALDDEKRRRAVEANRRDLQGSQLARLFFSQMGTQDETFNFMGL